MKGNKILLTAAIALVLIFIIAACEFNSQNNSSFSNASLNSSYLDSNEISFEVLAKTQNSQVPEKDYAVLRSEQEYSGVLSNTDSANLRTIPVNFSNDILIAVFQGQKNTGGYGISIKKITDDGETLTVYVQEISPGGGCMVTMALTSPYSIVKIQKTDKRITFKTESVVAKCK